MSAALTDDELRAMDLTGELANLLARIVGDGPTRAADLAELYASIHVIQSAVMAQAGARAYPDRFRMLGETVTRFVLIPPSGETAE